MNEFVYRAAVGDTIFVDGDALRSKATGDGLDDRRFRYASVMAPEKYSPGHAFGIVVGYVICGNPAGGAERVRKTLSKEPTTETGYDSAFGWQGDDTVCTGHLLYRTRHKQALHNNAIELIHAFVSLN